MTSFRKSKTSQPGSKHSIREQDPAPSETSTPSSHDYMLPSPTAPAARENQRELLTKQQVCERLRVCIRSFDKMLARQEFPNPVRLGKRDYWSSGPVDHWLSRRFAVQEAWRIS